jgi:2'-5' RNA ligase
MRAFIAIELPEEIKKTLSGLQDKLRPSGADVKWVAPENIHLTLKFLGEITEDKSKEITGEIENIAGDTKAFFISLSSPGAFPNVNSPRVIWIGIDKGDLETKKIANRLEEKISELGIPREDKEFSSHVTIGRVKSALNRDKLVNTLKAVIPDFQNGPEFPVTKITLFKSTLMPKGPFYEAIKEVNLKTS